MKSENGVLKQLLTNIIGADRAARLFQVLLIHPTIAADQRSQAPRAALAQALNMLLFEDLLGVLPAAENRTLDRCLNDNKTVMHDHGAVRTVALEGMGALPAGQEAITRILLSSRLCPQRRLSVRTSPHRPDRSHAQVDYPEDIAQFFISELHPDRFSPEFQQAVQRVTSTSINPVTSEAESLPQTSSKPITR